MPHRNRILLSMQFYNRFGRDVARGVLAYARRNTNWRLWHMRELDLAEVQSTRTAGVIAQSLTEQQYEWVLEHRLPLIVVGHDAAHPLLSGVSVDEGAVGQMAAAHLIDSGFQHFAFVGSGDWAWVHVRRGGFDEALAEKRLAPAKAFIGSLYEPQQRLRFEGSLEKWLRKLPRPCGVFAGNDATGVVVIAAARRLGLRVPNDLAVIGVDDDELACELSEVPLSSIAQPLVAIGREAGRLLHLTMRKPPRPRVSLRLPPVGVVARASSDLVALEDQDIAQALQVIRDHATEPINVAWVIDRLPVARRSLERRFRQVVGRSLLEQIQHVRFQKVRQLLAETNLNLKQVAAQTGFNNAHWLATCFHQHVGTTPSAYRNQFRRI